MGDIKLPGETGKVAGKISNLNKPNAANFKNDIKSLKNQNRQALSRNTNIRRAGPRGG